MTSYQKQMEFHSSSLGDELEPIVDTLFSQTSTYLIHSKIGEGAFGKVAKCYKVATNETVACKIMKANNMTFEAQNELDVLKRLKKFDADRYNFVKFNDAFIFNNHVCMDFEMLDMSLCDLMMKRPERSFSVNEIRPILYQVATTLEFLQSQDIVHTDLKSDNIMFVDHVKQPLKVKVIDFGLACTSAYFGQFLYLQALAYRAPEVILGLPFTSAIDMWGLGCIAAELFLGDLLFPATSEYNMLQHIIQTRGELPQKLLREGTRTQNFFIQKRDGTFCRPRWVLMDPDWYDMDEHTDISSICLDDLLGLKMPLHKTEESMAEYEDLKDFFELLKKMLHVDPDKRITPRELLQDPFMTMKKVKYRYPDSFYLISCSDMMEACQGHDLDLSTQEEIRNQQNQCEDPLHPETTSSGDELEPILDTLFSQSSTYLIHSKIGEGAFGKVAKCFKAATKETVACKIMKANNMTFEAQNELDVLKRLKNFDADRFNFVKFNDAFIYKNHVCMDFEMLDMSLCDLMRKRPERSFSVNEIRPILYQVATTLEFLQSQDIVHTDLKSDNIMFVDHVKQPLKVKVIDFGLACTSAYFGQFLYLQALAYRAPEVILGLPFTSAIDMWGLGCIAAELFLGDLLFPATSEYNMLQHIIQTRGELPQKLLREGTRTEYFFIQKRDGTFCRPRWVLMDPDWYDMDEHTDISSICLDDLLGLKMPLHKTEESMAEYEDLKDFFELLKKMLHVDPDKRITPRELLQEPFMNMRNVKHRDPDSFYLVSCCDMMEACQGHDLDLSTQEEVPDLQIQCKDPLHSEKASLGDELEPIVDTIFSQSSTYLIHSKIGEGTFGKVAKCFKAATKETVACKIIKAYRMTFEAQNELEVLKRLKKFDADRYNFVKFNDAFIYNNHVCMDFEMLDMSLCDLMRKRPERSFSVNEIRPILYQVATTLEFLRSQDIVHTDLKSDNIMFVDHVKQPLKVKVIDFGLACTSAYSGQFLHPQALAYRAPEVILGLPFTSAIDMWGLGCIAAELFLGDLLFPATSEYNMLQHIIQTRGELPQKLLRDGTRTQNFFIQKRDSAFCRPRWELMDPDWYDMDEHTDISSICLDDLQALKMPLHKTEESMAEYEDLKDFFELLKKMLHVDPDKRITPRELLQEPFMSMRNVKYRDPDSFYLISCCDMMEACQGQDLDLSTQEEVPDQKNQCKDPLHPETASSIPSHLSLIENNQATQQHHVNASKLKEQREQNGEKDKKSQTNSHRKIQTYRDKHVKTKVKQIENVRQKQTNRQIRKHRNRGKHRQGKTETLRQNDGDGHKQTKDRHRQSHRQIETQAERQREKDNIHLERQRTTVIDAILKPLRKKQALRPVRDRRFSQTTPAETKWKVKPATKIWLIGSSYIKRGEEGALKKFGENFGLNAKVEWFGEGGMRWNGVLPRFYSEISSQSPPDILVVHAGGNDLGLTSAAELTTAMKRDLMQLHREFPHMKILLSSINERQAWRYGPISGIINDRKLVNTRMKKAAKSFGGVIIKHPFLRHYNDTLYLPDGVHFTKKGNDVFTSSICAAIIETLKQMSL